MSLEKTAAVVIALGAVAISHCVWSSYIRSVVSSAEERPALDPGVVDGQKETSENQTTSAWGSSPAQSAGYEHLTQRGPSIAVAAEDVTPSTSVDDASPPRPEGRDPSFAALPDWPSLEQLVAMQDDLCERTVRLWSAEGFLSLTPEELRRMLPTPDGYDFTGPRALGELLGGLPSEEDCARAVQSRRVCLLLTEAAKMDCTLTDLEMIPVNRRPANFQGIVEAFDLQRQMIEDDLMATLDKTTGYPHWSILAKLWREWDK